MFIWCKGHKQLTYVIQCFSVSDLCFCKETKLFNHAVGHAHAGSVMLAWVRRCRGFIITSRINCNFSRWKREINCFKFLHWASFVKLSYFNFISLSFYVTEFSDVFFTSHATVRSGRGGVSSVEKCQLQHELCSKTCFDVKSLLNTSNGLVLSLKMMTRVLNNGTQCCTFLHIRECSTIITSETELMERMYIVTPTTTGEPETDNIF